MTAVTQKKFERLKGVRKKVVKKNRNDKIYIYIINDNSNNNDDNKNRENYYEYNMYISVITKCLSHIYSIFSFFILICIQAIQEFSNDFS